MKEYNVELIEKGYVYFEKKVNVATITCESIVLDSDNKKVIYADGVKIEFVDEINKIY